MTTTTKTLQNKGRDGDYKSSRVLVIDDDLTICKVVALCLKKSGYEKVESIHDSSLAMEKIASFQPHMVLLDIFMPEVNGLEILKEIRADEELNDTIVLMLSSAGREEQFQSLEMGALGFIHKPVADKDLVEEVGKAFRVAARFGAF